MALVPKRKVDGPRIRGPFVWSCFFLILLAFDFALRLSCFKFCNISVFSGLGLHPFANDSFAFSLPVPVALMYTVYTLVLGLVFWYVWSKWAYFGQAVRFAWIMILAGSLANVVERVFLGYVRDFIQIGTGYLNLGDVYILAGVAFILYQTLAQERPDL